MPDVIAGSCATTTVRPWSGVRDGVETLGCRTADPVVREVFYSFYDRPDQVRAAFDRWVGDFGPPAVGLCRTGEAGVFPWSRQGDDTSTVRGRAACDLNGSGVPALVWSDEQTAVLGYVTGPGTSMDDLVSTWRSVLLAQDRPGVPVPPGDPGGVTRSVRIDAPGDVARLALSVGATVDQPSDLALTLIAPDGAESPLTWRGARTGAMSFDPVDALAWRPATGTWLLRVVDRSTAGPVSLDWWQLEVAGAPSFRGESRAAQRIPDNVGEVDDVLVADLPGPVHDVAVSVDVAHSFVGDLIVEIVPPAGAPVTLRNKTGGGTRDLVAVFTPRNTPELATVLGTAAAGPWTLRIKDRTAADSGELRGWQLRVR